MRDVETHLSNLEPEPIEIMREVVSEAENLVMLYSVGKYSPYEAPETPEIHIDTTTMSIDDSAEQIVKHLLKI